MKKLVFLFSLVTLITNAQFKVKGTMKPVGKNTWALLYKIEGAKEIFIKNSEITKKGNTGFFEFDLSDNDGIGMYRIKYNLQQKGSLDFLFNKENITFSFDPTQIDNTVAFQESRENQLYRDFLYNLSFAQYKLDSIQIAYLKNSSKDKAIAYNKALQNLEEIQENALLQATGSLASNFIKATDRYNSPTVAKSSNDYMIGVISHFYDNIDFDNNALYNSPFLVDRIADYVFYMHHTEDPNKQNLLYEKACNESIDKIDDIKFKRDVIEFLIAQFATLKNTEMVSYLFNKYYDNLPVNLQNKEFKKEILASLATAIGNLAPDFSWSENGVNKSLHTLNDGENYLLFFYSTGCYHCLNEIPKVFELLKDNNQIKVIAFAIEEDATGWNNFKETYPDWHNVLGLGKWENKVSRTYQINSTPTYFILDENKIIMSNPYGLEDLKKILTNLKK